jgi:hypothetical protein
VYVLQNAGSKLLWMGGDERALVLASGILNDTRVDVSRMVGLGVVVHRSCRAPHGAAWREEVDVRAMLERATRYEPSVVEGRFMIHSVHRQRPWIVIVEPDAEARLLVVVTVYEVSG